MFNKRVPRRKMSVILKISTSIIPQLQMINLPIIKVADKIYKPLYLPWYFCKDTFVKVWSVESTLVSLILSA